MASERHQPLYLKYRPGTLTLLVGQPAVTRTLTNALEHDRLSHAYLFTGPRGCGKTSSARILAKCLNCEAGPTPNPCQKCTQCVEISEGRSPCRFRDRRSIAQ
jgi:DNA polymerase III subunit gamma/tau